MENKKMKMKEYNKVYNVSHKNSKAEYNRKWNTEHKNYFKDKVECKICHKIIRRSGLTIHHRTNTCKEMNKLPNLSMIWNGTQYITE